MKWSFNLDVIEKGNVSDSQMIVRRCLCGIIDGAKNAGMTKINGVLITGSQLFALNLIFLSLRPETKTTGEDWEEGDLG